MSTAMRTLHEIGDDLRALEELLFEIGGDVTDEQVSAAIDQWLEENRDQMRAKLDAYGAMIRQKESLGQARKTEADRLAVLAQVDLNTAKRLKERLFWFFQANGVDRLETDRFKFSLAANGGKAPVILKCEAHELPEEFRRVSVSADVEAIRSAIDAGRPVEFAEIGERGKHLRVR